MTQQQQRSCSSYLHGRRLQRHPLLQQHPYLMMLGLCGGSLYFLLESFSINSVFPGLTLVGAPSMILCLLFASILGVCGIVVFIISLLELVDNRNELAFVPGSKENCYDRN